MAKFNFDVEVAETSWLIDKLIPAGHLCFVLAQAGVGKSLLLESIAMSLIHAVPYASLKTEEGNVLIIDQDTPADVLTQRLLNLKRGIREELRHELYVESMRGYSLGDGTLISCIKEHSDCRLVIVDCLHSVCGKLNSNYVSDMNSLAKLKAACLSSNTTIIFNHHISQKEVLTVQELMTGDPGHLAMGSSAIIQQADSYYIVGATAEDGRTNRMFVRPVSKRTSIPSKPLILRLLQTDSGERVEYDSYYETDVGAVENNILLLFREQNAERTVKEVYDAMGHTHGENAIRDALAALDAKGLVVMSRSQHNLFKYHLP